MMCLGALSVFHVLRLFSLLFSLSCFLRQALLPLKQHFCAKAEAFGDLGLLNRKQMKLGCQTGKIAGEVSPDTTMLRQLFAAG